MTEPIPHFANEAEEAAWWDAHPEVLEEAFRAAKRDGRMRRLSETALPGASETAAIHISDDELARARRFAAQRGLTYQRHLKMLLHEALDNEEKKLAS